MSNDNRIGIDSSKLSGPLFASMTNDLMFRSFMQNDRRALKGLVCALLKIRHRDVSSLEITNPVMPGSYIESKEYQLDLKLVLNDSRVINIEMEATNRQNWPERSLLYQCRNYDNVNRGGNYMSVKPAIHIGILDYTVFRDHPEFYATYRVLNVRDYSPYTDKFELHVLDLTRTDLATDEDRKYGIDRWARLFKVKTWEELKMLAAGDIYMDGTVFTIAKLSDDERLRMEIEAREEFLKIQRTEELWRKLEEEKMKKTMAELKETKTELTEAKAELSEANTVIAEYKKRYGEL